MDRDAGKITVTTIGRRAARARVCRSADPLPSDDLREVADLAEKLAVALRWKTALETDSGLLLQGSLQGTQELRQLAELPSAQRGDTRDHVSLLLCGGTASGNKKPSSPGKEGLAASASARAAYLSPIRGWTWHLASRRQVAVRVIGPVPSPHS